MLSAQAASRRWTKTHERKPDKRLPNVHPVPRNFIMFINDLTTTAPIYKYVDDSTIFEVCKEGDTSQIQESVDMVDIWTSQNDMRLNSEKCKEMIIDFSRNYSLKEHETQQ